MVTVATAARRGAYTTLLLATITAAWLLLPTIFGGRVSYVEVTGHSMDPNFSTGDLVAVRQQAHYHIGDVIAYRIRKGEFGEGRTVIHRIVGGDEQHGFLTRGDNRKTDDMWHPTQPDIKGARWFRVPGVGATMNHLRTPLGVSAFAALLAIFAILAILPNAPPTDTRVVEDLQPAPAQ